MTRRPGGWTGAGTSGAIMGLEQGTGKTGLHDSDNWPTKSCQRRFVVA
jgi:hypothetical protein